MTDTTCDHEWRYADRSEIHDGIAWLRRCRKCPQKEWRSVSIEQLPEWEPAGWVVNVVTQLAIRPRWSYPFLWLGNKLRRLSRFLCNVGVRYERYDPSEID